MKILRMCDQAIHTYRKSHGNRKSFGVYSELHTVSRSPTHSYSTVSKETCRMYNVSLEGRMWWAPFSSVSKANGRKNQGMEDSMEAH